MKTVSFLICFFLSVVFAQAQKPGLIIDRAGTLSQQASRGNQQNKDTSGFEQRDDLKDSITISYRYMDALKRYSIDSSVNDFDRFYPVPSDYQYLGNNGSAAFPLIFSPNVNPGWDAGFHAYDVYKFTLEETKFYKTTRPFSLLGYQLASGQEQMVMAQHTQNIKPNFNAGFDYRLINSPGQFINQNNNHNAVRFFSNYQSKRKRYNAFLVLLSNTIRSSENGGIVNDSFLLSPNYKDRFAIDVNIGNKTSYRPNPFSTKVSTGNIYRNGVVFLRQSYDIGQKDSVAVNDSTTEYLFYPRLRLQHSFSYNSNRYQYVDQNADSAVYKNWYDINLPAAFSDTVSFLERWTLLENDFALVSFPVAKNPAQFLLAGVTLQNIKGELAGGTEHFYNIKLHGEYKNLTRNRLWDLQLKGEFYLNGLNSGDYNVTANLSRYLNKKFGDIKLFFLNTNRTPSFIFDDRSSFHLGTSNNFKKENIISFGGTAENPYINLGFANHLITNYTYFDNFFQATQSSKIINIIQASADKKIKLRKHLFWYLNATLQQTDASAPVRFPLLFTRSRVAFEGQFFQNLGLSTGLEIRYYTPYKANNYSPLNGQFVPQDSVTISNKPDIAVFLHFRIKSFTGFIRAENLNTVSFQNGFGFVDNNFAAPTYPTQGLIIRFGVRWWFVN